MRASAVAGIILANSYDELLEKLTSNRSMASVPFGGRYRLIDFSLSNLVNAGITNIGVITKENYRSLMDHLGSGVYWDLDRKNGGLRILPPYNIRGAKRYNGYIEAINGARDFIDRCNSEYMIICESEVVANIDISEAVNYHIETHADVTVIYHNGRFPKNHPDTMLLSFDNDGRVNTIDFPTDEIKGNSDYSLGIMIISRKLLVQLIEDAYNSEGLGINRDILASKVSKLRIYGFCHKGFAEVIDSEKTYYDANRLLLNDEVRHDLFNKSRPIFTKTRDDMPTRYGTKSEVENSFIADGCIIDGTVKNSILFRGVRVEKGAVIENSILMQGVCVSQNAQLDYVISDKDASIGADMILKGTSKKTFLVKKNQTL